VAAAAEGAAQKSLPFTDGQQWDGTDGQLPQEDTNFCRTSSTGSQVLVLTRAHQWR